MRVLDAAAIRAVANWPLVIEAMRAGHRGPTASTGEVLLADGGREMLTLSAWVPGLGPGIKAVTVFPGNPAARPPRASVQGQVILFDDGHGAPLVALDGAEITAWKTAGDSALGADFLARPDARTLLMIGAGAMAEPLIRAHRAVRPAIDRILLWNRTRARAEALSARLGDLGADVEVVGDLDAAVGRADVISAATMATAPLIAGARLKAGAHVDLVGGYRPEMREADDEVMARGRIFVDGREGTVAVAGDLRDPIARGVIGEDAVLGDLYDLVAGRAGRATEEEITVYKNGGGAHLDVMVAWAIFRAIEGQG